MKYTLEFEINGLPKTTNAYKRQHWTHKWEESKKWKALVAFETHGRRPAIPLFRAKLTLTRSSSSSPDSDGLVSSFKHVIDGLVYAKIISNDKYENIGMPEYKWEKSKRGKGKIKVKVEETE